MDRGQTVLFSCPMKSIVIHIGTEKTGTTSLQKFFSINADLLGEAGIWYPDSERLNYCHRHGHFPLAASLFDQCPDFVPPMKHFDAQSLYRQLLADFEKRPETALLLSCEHFSSRCSNPQMIARLRDLLSDYHVRILLYVRPQHELMLSAYSTFLKMGGQKTLEEVARERWLNPQGIYLNYYRLAQRWWKVFGQDRVRIQVFQTQSMPQGSLYRDLISVFDGQWRDDIKIPELQNPPICKELADLLYLANQHFPAFQDQDRAGWEMGQHFRREVINLFSHGRPLRMLMSEELKAETTAIFAPLNEKLARQARPDLNGQLFVPDDTGPVTTADNENHFTEDFVYWLISQWKTAQSAPTGRGQRNAGT